MLDYSGNSHVSNLNWPISVCYTQWSKSKTEEEENKNHEDTKSPLMIWEIRLKLGNVKCIPPHVVAFFGFCVRTQFFNGQSANEADQWQILSKSSRIVCRFKSILRRFTENLTSSWRNPASNVTIKSKFPHFKPMPSRYFSILQRKLPSKRQKWGGYIQTVKKDKRSKKGGFFICQIFSFIHFSIFIVISTHDIHSYFNYSFTFHSSFKHFVSFIFRTCNQFLYV